MAAQAALSRLQGPCGTCGRAPGLCHAPPCTFHAGAVGALKQVSAHNSLVQNLLFAHTALLRVRFLTRTSPC